VKLVFEALKDTHMTRDGFLLAFATQYSVTNTKDTKNYNNEHKPAFLNTQMVTYRPF
jgi:hypothetical protein